MSYRYRHGSGMGRKGTKPSLVQKIIRAGSSSKASQHLQTLLGQRDSYTGRDKSHIDAAMEILYAQGADLRAGSSSATKRDNKYGTPNSPGYAHPSWL